LVVMILVLVEVRRNSKNVAGNNIERILQKRHMLALSSLSINVIKRE
jgi:hypothetical protein